MYTYDLQWNVFFLHKDIKEELKNSFIYLPSLMSAKKTHYYTKSNYAKLS